MWSRKQKRGDEIESVDDNENWDENTLLWNASERDVQRAAPQSLGTGLALRRYGSDFEP